MDNNVIHTGSMNTGTENSPGNSHEIILQRLEEINNRLKKIEEHLFVPLINDDEDKKDAVKP